MIFSGRIQLIQPLRMGIVKLLLVNGEEFRIAYTKQKHSLKVGDSIICEITEGYPHLKRFIKNMDSETDSTFNEPNNQTLHLIDFLKWFE